MKFFRAAVYSGCLMLFGSCVTHDPVRPELPSETSMNKGAGRGDALFVSLRLETGEELRFILDTGATITHFDKSLESKLGKSQGKQKIYWSGGKYVADLYAAPKLFWGNRELMMGHQVITFDFKQLHYPGPPIMGVLGMDCLGHYCFQLDFTSQKVRFLNPDTLENKDLGKAFPLISCPPLAWYYGWFNFGENRFSVRENLAGVKGASSMIDTGCNFDGVLTPQVFQHWTNDLRRVSTAPTSVTHFPNGLLGGESYTNLYLHGDGRGNLIGLSFFARNLVTLNFPKRTMYLRQRSVGSLAEGSFDKF
jgi:hypothetical protein